MPLDAKAKHLVMCTEDKPPAEALASNSRNQAGCRQSVMSYYYVPVQREKVRTIIQ